MAEAIEDDLYRQQMNDPGVRERLRDIFAEAQAGVSASLGYCVCGEPHDPALEDPEVPGLGYCECGRPWSWDR